LFPGATFLSIYMSIVFNRAVSFKKLKAAPVIYLLCSVSALCVISVYFYDNSAFKRVATVTDFSHEAGLRSSIQRLVPKNKNAIFFGNAAYLYWLSGRYPNIPFVFFDVQATHAFKKNPDILLDALRDPDCRLVEFNPVYVNIPGGVSGDREFFNGARGRFLLQQIKLTLNKHFTVIDFGINPYLFWVRREYAE